MNTPPLAFWNTPPLAFWSVSATGMLQHLGTGKEGLSGEEAEKRLALYGSNLLKPAARSNVLTLLLAQFKSPLILILLFATALSFFCMTPPTLSSYSPLSSHPVHLNLLRNT